MAKPSREELRPIRRRVTNPRALDGFPMRGVHHLYVNRVLNLHVETFPNEAAAIAAGLDEGDVYAAPDGSLKVVRA